MQTYKTFFPDTDCTCVMCYQLA